MERLDKHTYRYTADVFDAGEMLPWLRTFIGRIVKLESSNDFVVKRFHEDLEATAGLYGGDGDAVS